MLHSLDQTLRYYFKSVIFISVLLASGCTNRHDVTSRLHPDIQSGDLQLQIKQLRPGKHKVREAGSPQEAVAAHYIANNFDRYGLSPVGDDSTFYQEFTVTSGVRIGKSGNQIKFGDTKFSSRFSKMIPWPNSISAKIEGALAWAGYGITNQSAHYDDYQNLDVNGKVVLFIRSYPRQMQPTGPDDTYPDLAQKIRIAWEKGAVAVLVAPGYQSGVATKYFTPEKFDPAIGESNIPVMQISNHIASRILANAGLNYRRLQSGIRQSEKPTSRLTNIRVQVDVNLSKEKNVARNVLSLVKGSQNPNRYIIVSSPYDYMTHHSDSIHTVKSNDISSSDFQQLSVAGLLELAHYFSMHKPRNSLLFVALSGMRFGRSGLRTFWEKPPVDPERILAMINIQDINRINQDSLFIYGTRSARGWSEVLSNANSENIPIRTISGYQLTSDTLTDMHAIPTVRIISQKRVPSSNTHNLKGAVSTLKYISRIIQQIDGDQQDTLGFSATMYTQPKNFEMPDVVLGVMPDYYFRGEGLRIKYVSKGGPASKAGIKVGDIITAIGRRSVSNLNEYVDILDHLHKGEKTTVTIKRNGRSLKLPVQF